MSDSQLIALSIRLTAVQLERLKALEKVDNITIARHVRWAVEKHIVELEEKYQLESSPPGESKDPHSPTGVSPFPSRKNPVISYR